MEFPNNGHVSVLENCLLSETGPSSFSKPNMHHFECSCTCLKLNSYARSHKSHYTVMGMSILIDE